jgi:alkaline phosphatase D
MMIHYSDLCRHWYRFALKGSTLSVKQDPIEMGCWGSAPTNMRGWVLFLGLSGGLGGCVSIDSLYSSARTGLEFGCASGDVTSTDAIIWLKGSGALPLVVQYGPKHTPERMIETDRVTPSADTDFTVKINLTELTPKTRYIYRAVVEGKQPGPLCQFVTAPAPDDPAPVTFVIGGDVRESFRPFTIMDAMRSEKPDFFIFLGDTIYSDKGKTAIQLRDYWAKYVENRDASTQRFLAQTSVFAMWDDHEVASDFSSNHPRMPIGRKAFFDYWPIRTDPQDTHRLYRSFRWGQALELFLLDTRQYRDRSVRTMLGPVQKQWLKDSLAVSSATIKFIVTSVPFSDPRNDKWGEYPQERNDILDFIGREGITGVVFLATDVHHAAVATVPGPLGLKEFIFGPLATTMNYKINPNEPRFEYFNDQSQNYGKISVKPIHPNFSVEVEWFDRFHTRLHRVEFEGVSSHNRVSVKPQK